MTLTYISSSEDVSVFAGTNFIILHTFYPYPDKQVSIAYYFTKHTEFGS